MKEYSLAQMMSLYTEKYPHEIMSSRLMIEGLQLAEMADKKVMPKMLNNETWEDTKRQIETAIASFVSKQTGNV
jgi:hypothetical protein